MKILIRAVLTGWCLLAVACASMPFIEQPFDQITSSLDLFRFDVANVPDVGMVYHYIKSNLDGSLASDVWIYIAAPLRTESFKIYPGASARGITDLVTADYDPRLLSASRLEAWLLRADGSRVLNATCQIDDASSARVTIGASDYLAALGHQPAYNYNFDWCDLAFMYRHVLDKEADFRVGVFAPTSAMRFVFAGLADFSYVGRDSFAGRDCRLYTVDGTAFGRDGGGTARFDAASGVLVEFALSSRNNPAFNSFRFVLAEAFAVTPAEWEAFLAETTRRLLDR